jgi:hypothetical protein
MTGSTEFLDRLLGAGENGESVSYGRTPISDTVQQRAKSILEKNIEQALDKIREGPEDFCSFDISNTNNNVTPIQYTTVDESALSHHVDHILQRNELEEVTYEDMPEPDYQVICTQDPGADSVVLGFQKFTNSQVVKPSNKTHIFIKMEYMMNLTKNWWYFHRKLV